MKAKFNLNVRGFKFEKSFEIKSLILVFYLKLIIFGRSIDNKIFWYFSKMAIVSNVF